MARLVDCQDERGLVVCLVVMVPRGVGGKGGEMHAAGHGAPGRVSQAALAYSACFHGYAASLSPRVVAALQPCHEALRLRLPC